MEIKIESVVIDRDQIKAVLQLEGLVKDLNGDKYDSYNKGLGSAVRERALEILVEKYLLDNTAKILASVDLQAVINAVTMKVAQNINGRC